MPTTYNSDFYGARALPSLSGTGAYLQYKKHFFELVCGTNSCTWINMEKQLTNSATFATMMYLPHDYTCWNWDSKCTCTYLEIWYFQTNYIYFLSFYLKACLPRYDTILKRANALTSTYPQHKKHLKTGVLYNSWILMKKQLINFVHPEIYQSYDYWN